MTYSIIQPPFTLKFRDMSSDELKGYRRWFLEAIPSRLVELQRAVNSDPKFVAWKPDHTRGSIEPLGQWLAHHVETRPRTAEEIDQIRKSMRFDQEVSSNEFTNKTLSLAMDAGMYFGETLKSHYPHLEWDQPLKDKRFADFGQMVLRGFGPVTLNPVQIVVTFFYGLVDGNRTAKRFDEIYGNWSRLADEVKRTAKAK